MNKNTSRMRNIEKVILLFIILQPLLDLITSLSIRIFEINLTFSLFVRFAFLFICAIYLVFLKKYHQRKTAFIYLLLLALILGINIINNFIVKSPFSIADEVKFILKTSYFIIMLLVYAVVFRTLDREKWIAKSLNYLVYSIAFIGAVMLISEMTGTSFLSYEGGKEGHVGWFFAGNEIGAVLAMGFPIVVLNALKKSKWNWIAVFLTVYSLLALGTKVGFITIFLVLIIGLVFSLVDNFKSKNAKDKIPYLNILLISSFIVGVILYTPYSPIVKNMDIQMSWLGMNNDRDIQNEEAVPPKEQVTDEQVQNLVFSGREKFLQEHKDFFRNAPLSQKLFGMGFGSNYTKEAKMVEMDFYDVFFAFGIIGALVFIAPLLFFLLQIAINFLRNFKLNFQTENILLGSSIVLGLGVAYTAGHVITAPAVSIYLAFIISYLWAKLQK